MVRATLILAALLASPRLGLAAQEAQGVAPGTRVRVTTRDSIYEGTILTPHGDSLRLLLGAASMPPVSVARGTITEIAVSAGRHSNAGAGAKYGFVLGAVAGLLMFQGFDSCSGFFCGHYDAATVGAGAVLSGAGVALFGALIGSASTSERWDRLPLSQVHVTIGHGGPGLALSFAF